MKILFKIQDLNSQATIEKEVAASSLDEAHQILMVEIPNIKIISARQTEGYVGDLHGSVISSRR